MSEQHDAGPVTTQTLLNLTQAAELVRLQNEADELRRELALERSKGFWARLLGK